MIEKIIVISFFIISDLIMIHLTRICVKKYEAQLTTYFCDIIVICDWRLFVTSFNSLEYEMMFRNIFGFDNLLKVLLCIRQTYRYSFALLCSRKNIYLSHIIRDVSNPDFLKYYLFIATNAFQHIYYHFQSLPDNKQTKMELLMIYNTI